MKALISLAVFITAATPATFAAAQSRAELRSQIEARVDERGLPDGVERACVIERAVQEHPNVPLIVAGPRPTGAAAAVHDENIRRLRVGIAVNTAITACTPAETEEEEANGQP